MNIALDYDGTYTADTGLWRTFILAAQFRGHTVYLVTLRDEKLDYEEEFDFLKKEYKIPIIFCNGRSKREVTEEYGIPINIFIDDQPEFIPKGVRTLDMTPWRNAR